MSEAASSMRMIASSPIVKLGWPSDVRWASQTSRRKTMELYILIGASGSGKSTHVRQIVEQHPVGITTVASSDDYFINEEGVYNFDGSKLPLSHSYSRLKAHDAMREGADVVIVDNTNTTMMELAYYMHAGFDEGYDVHVQVVNLDTDIETLIERNKHGVPRRAISEQLRRIMNTLENWPPFGPQPEYINFTVEDGRVIYKENE
jgi:predicted kinase